MADLKSYSLVSNGTSYVDIDLGDLPVSEGTFYVYDRVIKPSSILSKIRPTFPANFYRDVVELEIDPIEFVITILEESRFKIFVYGKEGSINGKYRLLYSVV